MLDAPWRRWRDPGEAHRESVRVKSIHRQYSSIARLIHPSPRASRATHPPAAGSPHRPVLVLVAGSRVRSRARHVRIDGAAAGGSS